MKPVRTRSLKLILPVLTIAWCLFIFAMSATPAIKSSQLSGSGVELIAQTVVPDYNEKNISEQIEITETIHLIIRKLAHFTEFGILGVLLAADIFLWWAPPKILLLTISFLLGSIYAASDEFHQRFVPGRSCELRDALIDSAGVLCGVALSVFVITAITRISVKQK